MSQNRVSKDPHTERATRRFAFMMLDVVGHSKIIEECPDDECDRVFGAFYCFVTKEINTFGGNIWFWAGDGCLCGFDGTKDQEGARNSYNAASAILRGLADFNRKKKSRLSRGNKIRLRIALHLGDVPNFDPENTGKLHSQAINFVAHMEKKFTLSDSISLSQIIWKQLPDAITRELAPIPEMFKGENVYTTAKGREHEIVTKFPQMPSIFASEVEPRTGIYGGLGITQWVVEMLLEKFDDEFDDNIDEVMNVIKALHSRTGVDENTLSLEEFSGIMTNAVISNTKEFVATWDDTGTMKLGDVFMDRIVSVDQSETLERYFRLGDEFATQMMFWLKMLKERCSKVAPNCRKIKILIYENVDIEQTTVYDNFVTSHYKLGWDEIVLCAKGKFKLYKGAQKPAKLHNDFAIIQYKDKNKWSPVLFATTGSAKGHRKFFREGRKKNFVERHYSLVEAIMREEKHVIIKEFVEAKKQNIAV